MIVVLALAAVAEDMFDELLDRASFGDLDRGLNLVLERIGRIEDDPEADEDDPRLDMLYSLANKIVVRMDLIIREHNIPRTGALAEWEELMKGYKEKFEKFEDCILEEDTLLDFE